jgi:hypothetical protein
VAQCPGGKAVLVPARVRRLTPAEYQATVGAVIGNTAAAAVTFPRDSLSDGYANNSDALRVTSVFAHNLWDAAPRLAAAATQALMAAAPCKPMGANNEMCAQQILTAAAARAYRRPASAEEMADLMDAYRTGATGADFSMGLTTAMRVVVQSAELLYHTELGSGPPANGGVRLAPHEIADQLAYLITGGPPDAPLTAAGDELLSADGRAAHAQRLLATAPARGALGSFAAQWLEISGVATPAAGDADSALRDPKLFPGWAGMRDRALAETQAFFSRAVLDENATLETLFTADWTVAADPKDTTMANFYGAKAPDPTGKMQLPAGKRAGLLTHAAVLASRAHVLDSAPVQRGGTVALRLMCQEIPPPPPTLNVTLPQPDPSRTTRQVFAAHSSNPACLACHSKIDPLGFAFENFDPIGKWRDKDNNQLVDASGTITGTDVDGPFAGAVDFVQKLGKSRQARQCFAEQWYEYASGYAVSDAAACGVRAAASDFIGGKGTVRDLIAQFVRSDSFIWRAPAL